ncbi:MAG: Maf family protein [Salinisphaeraceae bacterium]|nr:Maf family protein [Salinisphaeraceae bacterium]
MSASVLLASASPRRAALLAQLGIACDVAPQDIDETRRPAEPLTEFVQRLAIEKARSAWHVAEIRPVIGADTVVCVGGDSLGKPRDRDHALAMLRQLSGQTHEVLTAVAVVCAGQEHRVLSRSQVQFRAIGADEALAYWDTGEPADKAGGYAIQGLGAVFVASLEGSYSGVMGLPLFETAELLGRVGLPVLGTTGNEVVKELG